MSYSTSTINASSTTTASTAQFNRVWSLLLRCPSANTANVLVNLGGATATTGDLIISAGETISLDISPVLLAKILKNTPLVDSDFLRSLSHKSVSGTQTLQFDALRWND